MPLTMSENIKQMGFLKAIETEFPQVALVIMCGLPATCKTWAASLISERRGYEHLRTDIIRIEFLKPEDIFDEDKASNMDQRKRVYEVMFERAAELASRQKGVILDATFVKQSLRQKAAGIAAQFSIPLVIVHTQCPEDVALERISMRSRDKYESNAITPQAYYNNLEAFEPIDLDGIKEKFCELSLLYFRVETSKLNPEKWIVEEFDDPGTG